jgi:hypothetical protein
LGINPGGSKKDHPNETVEKQAKKLYIFLKLNQTGQNIKMGSGKANQKVCMFFKKE